MARTKKKAAPAVEHDAEQEAERQAARDKDSNVVDLIGYAERALLEDRARAELAEQVDSVLDHIESAKDTLAELKVKGEAQGIEWSAFIALVKLRRMEIEKRQKALKKAEAAEAERQRTRRAFGWQADLFEPEPGSLPGIDRPFVGGEEARDPAVQAALDAGFLTEQELADNAALQAVAEQLEAQPAEEIEGDADSDLLARAGIAAVVAGDE